MLRSFMAVPALLALALFASSSARAQDRLVDVRAERLFIPTGFDANDAAQVVVDGVFPNSCYKIADGEFTVDAAARTVSLKPMARVVDGVCLQILVPYTYVFNLGELPAGDYAVKVPGVLAAKPLPVAASSGFGPDDFFYAAVDNASVDRLPDGTTRILIEGQYTSTCMRWDYAKVVRKAPDVLEVLPVVKIENRADCRNERFPFKGVAVQIPTLPSGRYLLHVRSMHGMAVNRVFSM